MDGDGIPDIISGSWPRELFIFRGREDGTFGPIENLKFASGENIALSSASAVFAVDWTGNGNKDLLVGGTRDVWLVPCGDKPMQFLEPVRLTHSGGQVISAVSYAHPVAADWNGNGRLDLVLGNGNGMVNWFPNEGKDENGMPKLGAPRVLVRAASSAGNGSKPAGRVKICVADFNGNGRMDLLLGDFGGYQRSAPRLTEEQQKEFDQLQAEHGRARQALQEKNTALNNAVLEEMDVEGGLRGMTPDQRREFTEKVMQARRNDPEYARLAAEEARLRNAMSPYTATYIRFGHVWVFERKADDAASPEESEQ